MSDIKDQFHGYSKEQLAALLAEANAKLAKAQAEANAKLVWKLSLTGQVSLYGTGRFPVTLPLSTWERVFDAVQQFRSTADSLAAVPAGVVSTSKDDKAMNPARQAWLDSNYGKGYTAQKQADAAKAKAKADEAE